MDSETVRIRLVFEEGRLLTKSQRQHGLKRTWILLKSHLHTISDFSSYLLDFFLLRDACPHGLTLSMDGFVLPPFEPASILKDKDIVRVKNKDENLTALDKINNCPYPSKIPNMVEGQPADIDVQLPANDESVKDCSDYKNEDTLHAGSNEKTVCTKRKALRTLHSSKIKKNRSSGTAKCLLAPSNLQRICTEHNQRLQQDAILSEKILVKKHKSSNHHTNTDGSNKKNQQQRRVEESNSKVPDENYSENSEQLAGSSDDEELVSVEIRPGHVRFLPIGRVITNQFVHPAQTSMETLGLDGKTIKKRGQKWGEGNSSSWRSNCENCVGQSSTQQVKKNSATASCPIDFDKLRPCASLPKRGDIIAYRLIELSSSWTPELSSFRVGEVSWCKPEANKIMLIPVPEYPFVFKKEMSKESATQVDTSPYAEDGSLKADYSSLVDIRIVEHENSIGFEAAATKISEASSRTNQSWDKWENHTSTKQSWKKWENHTGKKQSWKKWENHTSTKQSWKKWENHTSSARENGKKNGWDEILHALSAKKTNLSNKVGWNRVEKKA